MTPFPVRPVAGNIHNHFAPILWLRMSTIRIDKQQRERRCIRRISSDKFQSAKLVLLKSGRGPQGPECNQERHAHYRHNARTFKHSSDVVLKNDHDAE